MAKPIWADRAGDRLAKSANGLGAQGCIAHQPTGQWKELPTEPVGDVAPNTLRRFQHDADCHNAENDQIGAGEVGQEFTEYKINNSAKDGAFNATNSADHGDEDHVHRPIVDAEGRERRNTEL